MTPSPLFRTCLAALALTTVMASGYAQAPQDVPQGHWAYKSLDNLYNKVLFGYPDGLYRGNRPLSRYEFAVAISQLWKLVNGKTEDLAAMVAELEQKIKTGMTGVEPISAASIENLRVRVTKTEEGRAELAKLLAEFEKELASLGADVEGIRSQVGDIQKRVSILEGMKQSVKISGETSFNLLSGFSRDNTPALTSAGFVTGVGRGSYAGQLRGLGKDLTVLHDTAITLETPDAKGIKLKAVIGAGNALGANGEFSGLGAGPLMDGNSEVYVNELNGTMPFKSFRGTGDIVVGRYGHSIPMIFERYDNTPFFSNDRWDAGTYLIDGAKVSFDWTTTQMSFFGGRSGDIRGTEQTTLTLPVINVLSNKILPVDQLLGGSIRTMLQPGAYIQGGYVFLDSNTKSDNGPKAISRMISLGGSAHLIFGPSVTLDAGMGKNIYKHGAGTVIDNDNESYFATLGLRLGSATVTGGLRRVEPISFLNGDWGSFGAINNPTGYTGTKVSLFLPTGFGFVSGSYENAEGVDPGPFNPVGSAGLRRGDSLVNWVVKSGFNLRGPWMLSAEYSSAQWDLSAAPDPYQKFLTFALNGSVGESSKFTFGLQLSDADSKGAAFLNTAGLAGRFKGGTFFSQFSYKF